MGLFLSPDHLSVLTDKNTWLDNPFVPKERRRDTKRFFPLITFCWMCGILLLVGGLLYAIIVFAKLQLHRIPRAMGGDFGTALCIIVSGIQIHFISGASRKHTYMAWVSEIAQDTLSSLLMLPCSAFKIVVQMMQYPWLVAMRLPIAMLPVYVLCVALEGITWVELFSLYLVFALIALSTPILLTPILNESAAIALMPIAKQSLFANRGASIVQPGVAQAQNIKRSRSAMSVLSIYFSLIPFALAFSAFRRGGSSNLMISVNQYIPPHITDLLFSVIISWPLMLARLFITPLDWYGTPVIPILFILPLYLLNRYGLITRVSEMLSSGAFRDLPLQATYRPRMRMAFWLRNTWYFVIIGYFWKFLVVHNNIGYLGQAVVGGGGLGGMLTLIMTVTAFFMITRAALLGYYLYTPLRSGERYILCQTTLKNGVWWVMKLAVTGVGLYLLACLVSRTHPFPATVKGVTPNLCLQMLASMSLATVGALFSFCFSRLLGSLSNYLRILLFSALIGCIVVTVSPDIQSNLQAQPPLGTFILQAIPKLLYLQILSPLMAVIFQGRANIFGITPYFNYITFLSFNLIAAGVCFALVRAFQPGESKQAPEGAFVVTLDPTQVGAEAFNDPKRDSKEAVGRKDTPTVLRLIRAIQSIYDNAIITKEMRSRLRGLLAKGTIISGFIVAVVLTVACFHQEVARFIRIFGGVSFLLAGPSNGSNSEVLMGLLGILFIFYWIGMIVVGFTTSSAFYTEVQKSTLAFLLTTPMSSLHILLGKWFGILLPAQIFPLGIAIWALIISMILAPLIGVAVMAGWFVAVSCGLAVSLAISSINITISALLPKVSVGKLSWIWMLLFYGGFFPVVFSWGAISSVLALMQFQGRSFFLGLIIVCLGITVICMLITKSAIDAMRRKDIVFEITKRSN